MAGVSAEVGMEVNDAEADTTGMLAEAAGSLLEP